MTTPNMGMTEPTVGVTPGPSWATTNNANTDIIDAHDHTSGKGARVPTAGLNVNADLPFNGKKATSVNGIVFSQVAVTDAGALYVGPTGDLYFIDGAANVVRLTVNGGLNLSSANITADLNLNGFRLTGAGSIVPTNNAGAIATALAFYIQTVSGNGKLRWNDANATVLDIASAYAVDPPVVTVATTDVALSVTGNPQVVLVDTSTGARTITLPSPTNQKKPITVVDKAGQASTNNITIARNAAESIVGVAASLVRRGNYGSITLFSDGTNWFAL